MLNKQSGMSLIQVMIGLGLMSVIGLGVAELMVTSAKVQQRSDLKLSQLVLLNEMQNILTSKDICSQMVKDADQTYNQTEAQSADGWDIEFEVSPTETYRTGEKIGNNLIIERLYLNEGIHMGTDSGIDTYRGKVTMEFSSNNPNTLGGALKPKEIGSIFYEIDSANKLVGCAKVPDTPANEICEDIGGEYNFATESCSKFKYAGCTSPSMPHGTSTTQNYTSGGRNCYRTYTCIDGQNIKTTEFCEEEVAAAPPPTPTTCTDGDTKTGTTTCWDGSVHGATYECNSGSWVKTSDSCPWLSCFTAETTIRMHNLEEVPISKVKIGDKVLGEDGAINEVYDIEVVPLGGRELFSFNDGPHFVTAEHPFKTTLGWKSFSPEDTYREHFFMVDEIPLEAGDLLFRVGKNVEMLKKISTRHDKSNLMVYNLRLRAAPISPYDNSDDRSNTYFANGYLVHNK
ncbi:MAG: hypothetical protein MK008_13750 [Bdellovibrionales bacterium]|nr:hypothetical protein [Bdellovibrionales bacterium]